MTVIEAFGKAYGELPEGVTCHMGSESWHGIYIAPYVGVAMFQRVMEADGGAWKVVMHTEFSDLFGPDISDRPASAFLGFFGDEYDAVVQEANS